MNKFRDACNIPKLNQEDINHINRYIMSNQTEIITKSPTEKSPGPDRFTLNFTIILKNNIPQMIL
jgi:hypothetical protein